MQRRKGRFGRNQRSYREHRLNHEIKEPDVRLVTEQGTELIKTSLALQQAKEAGLDLVEIASGQDTPIVRIIDYGKFKFEKSKKEKEVKKKQKVTQVKEVKMGPKIDVGDFERKCALAKKFIEEGDSVKVSMRFRGREMAHTELGLEKMKSFFQVLEEVASIEKQPALEGRLMIMVLRPKSKKGAEQKPQN